MNKPNAITILANLTLHPSYPSPFPFPLRSPILLPFDPYAAGIPLPCAAPVRPFHYILCRRIGPSVSIFLFVTFTCLSFVFFFRIDSWNVLYSGAVYVRADCVVCIYISMAVFRLFRRMRGYV